MGASAAQFGLKASVLYAECRVASCAMSITMLVLSLCAIAMLVCVASSAARRLSPPRNHVGDSRRSVFLLLSSVPLRCPLLHYELFRTGDLRKGCLSDPQCLQSSRLLHSPALLFHRCPVETILRQLLCRARPNKACWLYAGPSWV